jgi:hypothetical protein
MLGTQCLQCGVNWISLCVLHWVCSSKQKAKVTFLYVLEDQKMLHQFVLFFSRLWHTVWLVGNMVVEVCVCVHARAHACFIYLQCITTFTVKCSHPPARLYCIITKKTTLNIHCDGNTNRKLCEHWRTQEGHTVARHLVGSILLWKPGFSPSLVHVGYVEKKWHQDMLFSEHLDFNLSVSFRLCCLLQSVWHHSACQYHSICAAHCSLSGTSAV